MGTPTDKAKYRRLRHLGMSHKEAVAFAAVAPSSDLGTGGGSSVSGLVDLPPSTPNAMDDEFTGSSLDPKWSWVNQGAATVAVAEGALKLTPPAAVDIIRGLTQPAPAGNWRFRTKIVPPLVDGGQWTTIGLLVSNGTTHRLVGPGATHYYGQSSTGGGATSILGTRRVTPGILYVEAEYNGTNLIWRLSRDGAVWTLYTSVAVAAPSAVGIGVATADWIADMPAGAEWFRRVA